MSSDFSYSVRYKLLDHWRGVAALMVVLYHSTAHYRVATGDSGIFAAFAGAMWLGVQLFFVISGYCIAAAVESSFRRTNRPVPDYLARRVKRIFPPYLIWLAMLCLTIAVVESLAPQLLGRDTYRLSSMTAVNWFGNISLSETWLPHVFGQLPLVITRVGWTLCYEFQFYLVCMFLMFMPQKCFYQGIAAVTAFVLMLFLFEGPLGLQWTLVGTFLDGRWMQFSMGILVFYVLTRGATRSLRFAVAGLSLTCVVSLVCLDEYTFGDAIDLRTKRILELSVCSAFSILLLLSRSWDELLGNWRLLKPLQTIGVFSYSLYLVHWPICKVLSQIGWKIGLQSLNTTLLITTPVCIVVSVLAAVVFFRFCEQPFITPPSAVAKSRNQTVELST